MTDGNDQIVRQLEDDFPGWRFWRGIRRDGSLGSWCASRIDRNAGIYPTLVCDDVPHLRAQLAEQRERADREDPRPEVAKLPVRRRADPDWNPAYIV